MWLIFVLVYASIARLIPTVYNGTPFSNDVWPLIGVTLEIVNTGRVPRPEVSGHHVNWPGSVIFASVYGLLSGIEATRIYSYIGVSVTSISSALLVYAIIFRRTGDRVCALLASLGLSLFPSYTVYTSAFLKEVFAHTVMLLCLYLLLYSAEIKNIVLIFIGYSALLVSHPIPSLLIIAASLSFAYIIVVSHFVSSRGFQQRSPQYYFMVSIAWLYMFWAYNVLPARLPLSLGTNDLVMLFHCLVTVYFPLILLSPALNSLLMIALGFPTALYLIRTTSAPVVWFAPIFASPVVVILIGFVQAARSRHAILDHALSFSFTLPTVAIVLYVSTYAVQLLGILHRFLNYLVYGVVFSLPAIASVLEKRVTTALVSVFAILNVLIVVMCSLGLVPFLYYWRYTPEDIALREFLFNVVNEGVFESDPKYSYMMSSIRHITPARVVNICDPGPFTVLPVESLIYGVPLNPVSFIRVGDHLYTCRSIIYASRSVFVFGS